MAWRRICMAFQTGGNELEGSIFTWQNTPILEYELRMTIGLLTGYLTWGWSRYITLLMRSLRKRLYDWFQLFMFSQIMSENIADYDIFIVFFIYPYSNNDVLLITNILSGAEMLKCILTKITFPSPNMFMCILALLCLKSHICGQYSMAILVT